MLAAVNANSWRASSARKFSIRSEEVTPLKEALITLTDALAKRPTDEILFQWFRSARLVGEVSDLMKRRHPSVQAEIDRVYKEHLGERRNPKGAPVVRRE
jgi:hypothetical protein